MEALASSIGTTKQTLNRNKSSLVKDLCLVIKQGSLSEVDSALAALKKGGLNIDARNAFALTPLHIATWRNHLPIVRRLLAAGADPDARVFYTFKIFTSYLLLHVNSKCIIQESEAMLVWPDSGMNIYHIA